MAPCTWTPLLESHAVQQNQPALMRPAQKEEEYEVRNTYFVYASISRLAQPRELNAA